MSIVAYVTFTGFYTATLARREPAAGALAVLQHGKVLDSNAKARKMGIVPGIASSEARYAARSGQVHFVGYQEEDYAEAARTWLDICCEYCSVIEPVAPHCAYLDLQALPAPHEIAEPLAADLYQAIRLCPRVGMASSKLIARIAGRALHLREEASFLSQLPIESLWPIAPEHRKRLRFLGYRTIGEVAALPSSLLKKQFGEQGLTIQRFATGIDPSPVLALYPPETLSARVYFPQPAQTDAEIEVGLRELADDLCKKMACRDVQTRSITLTVAFDSREERVSRRFNRPMRSTGALLTGIRLTLRKVHLEQDVAALHVQVEQEPATDTQYAMELDKTAAHASPVVSRLKDSFGSGAIYSASEVVTPRRKLLLRAYEGEP